MARWDGFRLDVEARRLEGPDGDIHLEPQVFDVLALLVDQRERVVSKVELLEQVWGDQFVSESALTTRIKQVRQSLGDDGRTQRYIRNVHGRGYQFVGRLLDDVDPAPTRTGGGPVPGRSIELAREIAVDDDFPFVGRSTELDTAAGAVAASSEGAPTLVLVAGTPGVGKSRLAVEVLERARRDGAAVGAGRCERQVTSALQAVRDAFAQLAEADPDGLRRWAAGVEGQLVSMIPSLARHLDHEPIPVDTYAGVDVFLTAIDSLASTRPTVLLIDDLQWSDEATRVFIDRVARRLRTRPITVVITHRTGRADLPSEVARWLADRDRTSTVRVELGAMGDEPARELVRAVLDDATDGEVDELIDITGANGLFLTETLRDLPHGRRPAQSVAELITARLERQPDEVRRIIEAGAALGPEFALRPAALTAGLDAGQGLDAIDRALEAELLHETSSDTRFRFSHQIVPQAILDGLGRADRARLHLRCAEGLTQTGASDAEVVLHQLRAVPLIPVEEAVAEARTIAGRARDAGQFDLALRILRQANETEPPARTMAEIQLELGLVINDVGTPARAIEILDPMIAGAWSNGWPDLVVAGALAYWSLSPYRRPSDQSTLGLLQEAETLLGPDDSVDKALVLAKTAAFSVFTLRLDARLELADRAIAMARSLSAADEDLLRVLEGAAIAATCPAGAARLADLDREIDDLRTSTGRVYFNDASAPETLALMHGDGAEFRRWAEADPDRLVAQPIAEWRDLALSGTLASFAGDIDEARAGYDRAAEIGEAFWGESAFSLHGFGHFYLDLVSGDWSRSRELLGLLVDFSAQAVFLGPYALALHHEGGDAAEVERLVAQIGPRQMRSFPEHIVGGNALVGCAELAIALDNAELAGLVEGALEPLEDLMLGLPWAPALAAADVLARLADHRGDAEAAEAHRRRAAAIYQSLDAPGLVSRLAPPG
ncbi:MAG: AAA family ATPase [Actinomycetota bacterium]